MVLSLSTINLLLVIISLNLTINMFLVKNEELNSVVKHNKTEIAILKDTIEELRAKIKTQDAIIEINKEKIEKQDKEIQSYKNINKQSKSDL